MWCGESIVTWVLIYFQSSGLLYRVLAAGDGLNIFLFSLISWVFEATVGMEMWNS